MESLLFQYFYESSLNLTKLATSSPFPSNRNRYAEFWGYTIDEELLRFLTVISGEGFMMTGVFWFALLRGEHTWKAYGVAALVYFGCTIDFGFISRTGWISGEATVWIDLALSYIAIITAQPWTIFV